MRVERALVGLLLLIIAAPGCGRLAYNLPPAQRLMEPGPGVGGPGPGVIPPAGSAYGMPTGQFSGEMGPMGGGYATAGPGAPNLAAPAPAPFGTAQAGPCECADGSCSSGPTSGPQGDIQQVGFHRMLQGGCDCMRPGSTEAYAQGGMRGGMNTSQIAFLGDDGVQISWDTTGGGMFDSVPLVIPGRQDFYQGGIYRLKLTNIPGRSGISLYPTLEVAPVTPRTDSYLAHSPVPVQFTNEDIDQVVSGNFVTKVIYLPDPEFQELALAGVETLVSTRLDPGVDPIAEADRRGSILAIVRMGNKDLERHNGEQPMGENIVPASHSATHGDDRASQAVHNESAAASGEPAEFDVSQVQYCQGGPMVGGQSAGMPMGMPTSGFAPAAMPPNMVAGGPQWGMPITGTPIGLPGPPHIPLGSPAGLQKHVMKNRTRVLMPPPVSKVQMTVKQRPGLNYPRPVNHVHVNETQREPLRLLPTWLTNLGHRAGAHGVPPAGPCPQ